MADVRVERFPAGTRVITLIPKATDYTAEAQARRRWGVRGKVVRIYDSHGECFDVRHDDGTLGTYDLDELARETSEVVTSPGREAAMTKHPLCTSFAHLSLMGEPLTCPVCEALLATECAERERCAAVVEACADGFTEAGEAGVIRCEIRRAAAAVRALGGVK